MGGQQLIVWNCRGTHQGRANIPDLRGDRIPFVTRLVSSIVKLFYASFMSSCSCSAAPMSCILRARCGSTDCWWVFSPFLVVRPSALDSHVYVSVYKSMCACIVVYLVSVYIVWLDMAVTGVVRLILNMEMPCFMLGRPCFLTQKPTWNTISSYLTLLEGGNLQKDSTSRCHLWCCRCLALPLLCAIFFFLLPPWCLHCGFGKKWERSGRLHAPSDLKLSAGGIEFSWCGTPESPLPLPLDLALPCLALLGPRGA